jgi:hypothetical protein
VCYTTSSPEKPFTCVGNLAIFQGFLTVSTQKDTEGEDFMRLARFCPEGPPASIAGIRQNTLSHRSDNDIGATGIIMET